METTLSPLAQRPTGIAGLDLLLRGGLVEGSVYLVVGQPGTGKTTLGNHVAFNTAKAGARALYVTVVAESHDRMIRNLTGFDFLDVDQVGKNIYYLNVYDALVEDGLDGVQAVLRRAIRERGYDLLIVDGATILEDASESHLEYSRFIGDLSAQLGALNCIGMLLAVSPLRPEEHVISPYVDGLFMLENQSVGLQDVRYLHLIKMRGVQHVRGRHRFNISPDGITVYPRLESVLDHSMADPRADLDRIPTGVAGLDDILNGGMLAGSISMVSGPPGVGKSMLGLQFIIAGLVRNEPCLIATFHESSRSLSAMADGLGHDLQPYLSSGQLRLFPNFDPELAVDDWAWQLMAELDEVQPSRVVVDGMSDVARLRLEPLRVTAFYRALTGNLTSRGITAVFTNEASDLCASNIALSRTDFATVSDNVILLRYIEVVSRMYSILSILKVRGAGHDNAARELRITERGIEMPPDGESAARLLRAARQGWLPDDARETDDT